MDPTIIVFIALAAFIAYRLYSVLGARTGEERERDVEGLQRARPERDAPPEVAEPEPAKPAAAVSPSAAPLREADPAFDEKAFLAGARGAYELIVEAFAAGDIKSVRRFLGPGVFEAFRSAVAARESEGRRADLKFVGIDDARIASSRVENGTMIAVTDFISNQVRATYDQSGTVVEGDPSRIDLVRDRWTFSRAADSSDPNWTLIATGAV